MWRRWSRGSVLAFGTQVRGFKPGRSRRTFQGEKILSTPSFGGEVKPSVPCRRFTACKRFLNATWKSGISDKIYRPFLAHIVRSLATRISGETTKGSAIRHMTAVHPGHQLPEVLQKWRRRTAVTRERIKLALKCYKNNQYSTWRPIYI